MSSETFKIIHSVSVAKHHTISRADTRTKTIKPSAKRLGYSHQQREQLAHILLELR